MLARMILASEQNKRSDVGSLSPRVKMEVDADCSLFQTTSSSNHTPSARRCAPAGVRERSYGLSTCPKRDPRLSSDSSANSAMFVLLSTIAPCARNLPTCIHAETPYKQPHARFSLPSIFGVNTTMLTTVESLFGTLSVREIEPAAAHAVFCLYIRAHRRLHTCRMPPPPPPPSVSPHSADSPARNSSQHLLLRTIQRRLCCP